MSEKVDSSNPAPQEKTPNVYQQRRDLQQKLREKERFIRELEKKEIQLKQTGKVFNMTNVEKSQINPTLDHSQQRKEIEKPVPKKNFMPVEKQPISSRRDDFRNRDNDKWRNEGYRNDNLDTRFRRGSSPDRRGADSRDRREYSQRGYQGRFERRSRSRDRRQEYQSDSHDRRNNRRSNSRDRRQYERRSNSRERRQFRRNSNSRERRQERRSHSRDRRHEKRNESLERKVSPKQRHNDEQKVDNNNNNHATKFVIDKRNPLFAVMNKHVQLAGKIIITDKTKIDNMNELQVKAEGQDITELEQLRHEKAPEVENQKKKELEEREILRKQLEELDAQIQSTKLAQQQAKQELKNENNQENNDEKQADSNNNQENSRSRSRSNNSSLSEHQQKRRRHNRKGRSSSNSSSISRDSPKRRTSKSKSVSQEKQNDGQVNEHDNSKEHQAGTEDVQKTDIEEEQLLEGKETSNEQHKGITQDEGDANAAEK